MAKGKIIRSSILSDVECTDSFKRSLSIALNHEKIVSIPQKIEDRIIFPLAMHVYI